MPRIQPIKTIRHKRHLDEYWPGLIYSTWSLGNLRIRRERRYSDRYHKDLKSVTWQLWYGGHSTTSGFRVERRAPYTRNW